MGEERDKEAIMIESFIDGHSEQLCVNLKGLQKELKQLGGEIDELSVRKYVYRDRELNDKIKYCQGCLRSNNSSQGDNYYTICIRNYQAEQLSIPKYPEACFLEVPDNGREVLKCGSLLRKKRELRKQMLEDKRALTNLDYLFRNFPKPKEHNPIEDIKAEIKKVLEGWNGTSALKQHYVEVFSDKSCDKAEEQSEEEEKKEDEKKEDEKAKPAGAGKGKRHRKRQNDASKLLRKSKSDVKPVQQQEIRPAPAVEVELVQPEQPRPRNRQNPFRQIKKPKAPPPAEAEAEDESVVAQVKTATAYAAQGQMKTVPYIKSIARKGYAVLIMLLAIIFGGILLQSTSISYAKLLKIR